MTTNLRKTHKVQLQKVITDSSSMYQPAMKIEDNLSQQRTAARTRVSFFPARASRNGALDNQ